MPEQRETVSWFAEQIERRLRETTDAEFGDEGWLGCSVDFLVSRMLIEVGDLQRAMLDTSKPTDELVVGVVNQAASISTWAMMLAHTYVKWTGGDLESV